jgi:hypothetical protein
MQKRQKEQIMKTHDEFRNDPMKMYFKHNTWIKVEHKI